MAFPGIQIGSLSLPIHIVPTGHSRRLLKFWCFFIHYLTIHVGSNGFSVYTVTFYGLINCSWFKICIATNTQLGEEQWVYILWTMETIEYFYQIYFFYKFLICQLYQVCPDDTKQFGLLFSLYQITWVLYY